MSSDRSKQNKIWDSTNISDFATVISLMPPCVVNSGDKRYMIFTGSDGGWFLIDDSITLEMVMSRFQRYTVPQDGSRKILVEAGVREWKIPGSKGGEYTVTLKGGNLSCECMGFGFRRKCKHVEQAKAEMQLSI